MSPLSVAPMIDWTYTHFRVLMRLLAPKALLYTEMQTTGAIINNQHKALFYQPVEQPLALQLGGADVSVLATCAAMAEEQGYAEINLNLGCPSDRVQAGRFGACMMAEPEHVVACIRAMKEAVSIPVTAKTRIGIDRQDSYDFFSAFANALIDAGCDKLIVHARKAWLHGLNPKQNRTVPPLHYDYVYRIKKENPDIPVVINGNIGGISEIITHMNDVDGVMLGRLACQNPYALAAIHRYFYPHDTMRTRFDVTSHYLEHVIAQYEKGVLLSVLLKPVMNMAFGLSGAKRWKELLVMAQQKKSIHELEQAVRLLGEIESTCPVFHE
ncbi:tRNA dihydrouridine(20/20a) synthase DusA [Legionella spiritensis]|nr:tRNA dihydrouridine(20/20a) synthase DusA [Legionella spiritensis]